MIRTHSPKYASYFGDGSGRDSYVVTNNGGLTNVDKGGMTRRPFKNTLKTMNMSPSKDSMTVHYKSDGSGRDTYVVQNSGGLMNDCTGSFSSEMLFK